MLAKFLEWLLSLFATPVPVPLPDPPPPGPPPALNEILVEINKARFAHDLPPFEESLCLSEQAAKWATEMRVRGRMSHSGFQARLAHCSMQGGEIVAWGQQSAAEVVADWMGSRGHRARILSKSKYCGAGSSGTYWCALDGTPGTNPSANDDQDEWEISKMRYGKVA